MQAWWVVGVLFVVALLSQLDRQLPALVVRQLREEFGFSDTGFGMLQGYAFALSFTLAGLPLGRWVDRGNRRNLIVAGLLFWSGCTAWFALARSTEALVLARVGVGVGIGEAVLAPAAYSMIADLMPAQRQGRALAVYGVSLAVGSGASLLLGGWLLSAIPAGGAGVPGLGELSAWRMAFLAAAAPALPMALLLIAAVREPARQHGDRLVDAHTVQPSLSEFVAHLRRHPATLSRVLCFPTMLSLMGYGALAWAPALFERSHGMPPSRSGVVMGVGVAVAGAIGMLAGGFLSDAWLARGVPAARLRVALVGMALCALPAVLWPLVPDRVLAFGLLFLMVGGISLAQSAVPATLNALFPNRLRGQAIAVHLLLSGLLGVGLGPTAVALVTDRVFHDDGGLRYAIALVVGPAALLGLWLIASGLAPCARTLQGTMKPPASERPPP